MKRIVPVDIALAQDNDTGEIVMHTADCPEVRQMAADGHPVMTMFGCEEVPDTGKYRLHSCLKVTAS